YKAEQRKVSVQELIEGIKSGAVSEAFAAGTAATVTHISKIGFDGQDYELPPIESRDFSNKVLDYLNQLRYGKIEDPFGWNFIVLTSNILANGCWLIAYSHLPSAISH